MAFTVDGVTVPTGTETNQGQGATTAVPAAGATAGQGTGATGQAPNFGQAAVALRTTGATAPGSGPGLQLTSPGATAPARDPQAAVTAAAASATRPTLRQSFERLPGMGPTRARLLDDNVKSWVDRWVALRNEREKIDSFYFSVEQDAFGYAFLGALLMARQQNVPVRLGTDSVARAATKSFTGMDKDYLEEVANYGGDVRIYHPVTQRLPHEFLSRAFMAGNHDKILRLGKNLGYVGGRNIGRDYYRDPADDPKAWRDLDVRLEGAAAAKGLTDAFEAEFNRFISSKVWPDIGGNWVKRDIELIGAALMMDHWVASPTLTPAQLEELKQPAVAKRYVDDLVATAVRQLPQHKLTRKPSGRELDKLREIATELVQNPRHRGSKSRFVDNQPALHEGEVAIIDKTSSAGSDVDGIAPALTAVGTAAREKVVLVNPYVVLSDEMIETLAQISKNGVKIYLGTNSPLSTDSALTQAFFLQDWPKILARVPKLRLFVATGDRKFHLKAATADDKLSLVSTSNLDFLSFYVNSEVGALIWSESFAKETNQVFLDDHGHAANGVLEYTIERHPDGTPVLRNGEPVVKFGPQHHLTQEMLDAYRAKFAQAAVIRATPWVGPLNHQRTEDALKKKK